MDSFVAIPSINVEIDEYAFIKSKKEKDFVVYIICVKQGNLKWKIYRRYGLFHKLNDDLEKKGFELEYQCPPKYLNLFQTTKFLDRRRRELEFWLQSILKDKNIILLPEVNEFLRRDANKPPVGIIEKKSVLSDTTNEDDDDAIVGLEISLSVDKDDPMAFNQLPTDSNSFESDTNNCEDISAMKVKQSHFDNLKIMTSSNTNTNPEDSNTALKNLGLLASSLKNCVSKYDLCNNHNNDSYNNYHNNFTPYTDDSSSSNNSHNIGVKGSCFNANDWNNSSTPMMDSDAPALLSDYHFKLLDSSGSYSYKSCGNSMKNFNLRHNYAENAKAAIEYENDLPHASKVLFNGKHSNYSHEKICLNHFDLIQVIGKGSFGKVLQVRKKDTGKIYALKILKKNDIKKRNQVEHTKTERRVLGQVDHPYIVGLNFAFQSTEKLFLVLDYCPGGELFYHLEKVGKFKEERAKFYAAEIILALEHLHQMEIIYRDLKPENVLLSESGHIRITDFGLSKDGISGTNGRTNSFCGTPEYLAPEILERKGHGKAVDWWSFGALLYEMLTGSPPFMSRDRERLFKKIRQSTIRYPSYLSNEAVSLLNGLLTKNPENRLGSGIEDSNEVKNHQFFKNIDWDKMLRQEINPPWVPDIVDDSDTSLFDNEFTKLPVHSPYFSRLNSYNRGNQGIFSNGSDFDNLDFSGFTYDCTKGTKKNSPFDSLSSHNIDVDVNATQDDYINITPLSTPNKSPRSSSRCPEEDKMIINSLILVKHSSSADIKF